MDSRPDSDLPPIYSNDHTQLMQPMVDPDVPINLGGVLIPDQLLAQTSMVDREVYTRLVILARGSRVSSATMPPIRDFAKSIGISQPRVSRSLKRLHETGWITITNLKGPRDRFRIIVREKVKVLADRMERTELIQEIERLRHIVAGGTNRTLHNIYTQDADRNVVRGQGTEASLEADSPFPQHINKLIASIPHIDKRGKTLWDYRHVLEPKAHHAPLDQIQDGLIELFSYTPSAKHGGKIGSIIATWSAMFTLDDQGNGMLKRRPMPTPKPVPPASSIRVPIKDAALATGRASEFQEAVRSLLEHRAIYAGHLDRSTLARGRRVDAFKTCEGEDQMIELRDTVYAELDDEGLLQFHTYTRDQVEAMQVAVAGLEEKFSVSSRKGTTKG